MQFKQKLIYFALGCAFVVIGQVLVNVLTPKVTAQGKKASAEFDTVKVRSLQVVDASGKVCAILEKTPRTATMDDVIRVFNGVSSCSMGMSAKNVSINMFNNNTPRVIIRNDGMVAVYNSNGGGAVMSANGDGGKVSVMSNDGSAFPVATMQVDKSGGTIAVLGNDKKKRAMMCVGESDSDEGGIIGIFDKHGDLRGQMFANILGGRLYVGGNGGSVQVKVSKHGGRIDVFGKGNKTSRATICVNEYGHGAVSTWDKNGYRLP